jgi:prepilin-type N-terminal cleavage/methylation domain-containing protein
VTKNPVKLARWGFGFTLIELLIVVAVVVLLGSIAWPAWQTQKTAASEGLLVANIQSMALFQEDYRIRHGRYATDLVDRHAIATRIGWQPKHDDHTHYSIDAGDGMEYQVHAKSADGHSVCIRMPAVERCERL